MAFILNRTENPIDRIGRIRINENWDVLEREYGKISDIANNSQADIELALANAQEAKNIAEGIGDQINQVDRKADQALTGIANLNSQISNINSVANNANQNAINANNSANQALSAANEANDKSDSVQNQLDNIVINGDSSVEAAQARVGYDGTLYQTLKERIDTEVSDLHDLNQETNERIDSIHEIKDLTNNRLYGFELFIKDNHLGFRIPERELPGSQNLIMGNEERGYFGVLTTEQLGTIYLPNGESKKFDGRSFAEAIGLQTRVGQSLFHESDWFKYSWKGKTLLYPKQTIWYAVSWEEVYRAGAVYGDDTMGFLPPSGMVGYVDNPLRIDAVEGTISGRGFTFDFEEEGWYSRTKVGDKIRLAGWSNDSNNGVFTVTAITNTRITLQEKEKLVSEVGGLRTARFWTVSDEVVQNATVQIEGYKYRVRMMNCGNQQLTTKGNVNDFAINANDPVGENEYANLFLAMHEKAGTNTWDYSDIVDENHNQNPGEVLNPDDEPTMSDMGMDFVGITPNFNTNFTSRQLGVEQGRFFTTPRTDYREGLGTHVWFMNTSSREAQAPNERNARGDSDGSNIHGHWVTAYSENMGYRPVLELIGKA